MWRFMGVETSCLALAVSRGMHRMGPSRAAQRAKVALFSLGPNIQEWSQRPTTSYSFFNFASFYSKRFWAEQDRFEIFDNCFHELPAMASPTTRAGHLRDCFWYVWPCEAKFCEVVWNGTWIDYKPPPVSITYTKMKIWKSLFMSP